MKEIRGHKSWDQGEIVAMLEGRGGYTCPTLPHYRYDGVRAVCRRLRRLGLVRVSGRTGVSMNLVPTPLFREWQAAVEAGETRLGAVRWAKARFASAAASVPAPAATAPSVHPNPLPGVS